MIQDYTGKKMKWNFKNEIKFNLKIKIGICLSLQMMQKDFYDYTGIKN